MSAVLDTPTSPDEWRALRERRGLTIRELADMTGLYVSTLHRLEAGVSVTKSTRMLVAAALGLPVFDHHGGTS
jgi:transcriptional regulator with XRE-family HTH domain